MLATLSLKMATLVNHKSHLHKLNQYQSKGFCGRNDERECSAKDLRGEPQISHEHIANNAAVRDMLVQRGIVPENLLLQQKI